MLLCVDRGLICCQKHKEAPYCRQGFTALLPIDALCKNLIKFLDKAAGKTSFSASFQFLKFQQGGTFMAEYYQGPADRDDHRQAAPQFRPGCGRGHQPAYVQGLRPGAAGHHVRPADGDRRPGCGSEQLRQVHYLSLEFLMGRSLMKNAYNLGLLAPLTAGPRGPGLLRPRPVRGRARRGSGQRRPGPPGRLLPGLHDHPGDPRHRLFHLL